MRSIRRSVLGASVLALALFAGACRTGGAPSSTGAGATIASQLIFGGPPECPKRPFCIPGFKKTYGIEFKEFKPLDVGGPLTVAALKGGQIDVALLFTTSSVVIANDWVILEDDKNLQAADSITPVVNEAVVNDEITDLLNLVSQKLGTDEVLDLVGQVELDKKDPADVAAAFLEKNNLLETSGSGKGELTVGAVTFAENQIVAELYAQVLRKAGYTVTRTDVASREILRPAMESGDIDIAPEYLATLALFLDDDAKPTSDSDEVRELLVPLLKDKKQVLLESADAEDTNALVVTKETADKYDLSKTSDLAKET